MISTNTIIRMGAFNIFRFFWLTARMLSIWILPGNKDIKIRNFLETSGPAFTKLGQTLSSRADLIGEELAEELSLLCDKARPFPFLDAKKSIERELKAKIETKFSWMETDPIGSGSIAQVHKARTLAGELVAVKILRPEIEKLFTKDIKLMYFIAFILQFFISKRLKLTEVVDNFASITRFELDMRFEAANCLELKQTTSDLKTFYVPTVYWDLTSRRLLTTEWIDGKPINAIKNDPEIAENLAVIFFHQAYKNGFFHGDMHSGNLILTPDRRIAAVDFGIMGRLDNATRIYIAEILRGFINRDYARVADIHYLAGYVSPKYNNFATACRAIGEPIVGKPASQISVGTLLTHLFKITADFNMEVQMQLLLLQKTTVVVEGICSKLHPEVNLWEVFTPCASAWAKENITLRTRLCQNVQIKMLKSIPEIAKQYLALFPKQKHDSMLPYLKGACIILGLQLLFQVIKSF